MTSLVKLYENILNEVSEEQLRAQFVDSGKISEEDFDQIVAASKGKTAYMTWLCARVAKQDIKAEDIYKFADYLDVFEKNKRFFPSPDINSYRDARQVQDFTSKAIEIAEKNIDRTGGNMEAGKNLVPLQGVEQLASVGIKLLGTVDGYQCFKVPKSANNKEAWEVYKKWLANCANRAQGAKIEICTMAGFDHYQRYIKDGDYYVFYNLNDPLSPYQFHYESNQFMDKNDKQVI
jgi:hypothetical protein